MLLCGTSGTGKSTLASLLAARLGVTTVISTDSIRHMLRGFQSAEENPLLWLSTYEAGERKGCVQVPFKMIGADSEALFQSRDFLGRSTRIA